MRLSAGPDDPNGLAAKVAEVLDQRLLGDAARPVALALSGGGDSVALLLAAQAWAKAAGRPLLVLSVDHGLRPESADWTAACAERARRMGLAFRALSWTGPKPERGLPAAARQARHRLLAQAAREAGARVLLMGHTADDILEARGMRAAGATTPDPRLWGPSPVWPEGRGLFLLRPLLALRRAAVREWLRARGESWIEDPANADLRFARPRARQALAGTATAAEANGPSAPPNPLAEACRMDAGGVLHLPRKVLREADADEAAAFVGTACVCAAGAERPPSSARLRRLCDRLMSEGDVTATLAGARIEADADEVRFQREPGEVKRGGLAPLSIAAGSQGVWDGRFEIDADRAVEVRALAGLAARLPTAERAEVQAFPAKARPALPAVASAGGVTCLALDAARCRPLALERLHAAFGLTPREPR